MRKTVPSLRPVLALACMLGFAAALAAAKMEFIISMAKPQSHCFHVQLICRDAGGRTVDLALPAWTPGYYLIMNHARNVLNFSAADAAGKPLAWEKTDKSTWRVHSGQASSVLVDYDVYAFGRSVAESYLDDERGFISPTSVFMHATGRGPQAVTVTIKPYGGFGHISTGLEPVQEMAGSFTAPDFDALYDSPILVGNQQILPFPVGSVPHVFVADDLGNIDRPRLVADLSAIITAATGIFGEIPYRRYAFLAIGPGQGGLEHANSVAFTFAAADLADTAGYQRWLCFMAHEYFHLFNVKRIRPLALGPFAYDRENYTDLLWFSEGFTVYYEDMIMNRAGLLSRDEFLKRRQADIARYENIPGRRFQSAAAASFDIWCHFLDWGESANNTTISYYDKGAALALLLDLKIRHESGNRRALDDLMRTLYREYYKKRGRGFSSGEFRSACEQAAGCRLDEFFSYAETVRGIDYKKYLRYGGLDIDIEPQALAGAFLGASAREWDGKLIIGAVSWDSPAAQAGLCPGDEIVALDGRRAASATLAALRLEKKPGEQVRITVARDGRIRDYSAVLGSQSEPNFQIKPLTDPDPLQAAILKDWLR
jgi:predicted metalloprotease with PDZ domain